MLDFAVFGLPRSATTWAANWLTSGNTVCRHDPLTHMRPEEVLKLDGGIACTGLWLRDDLVEQLNCPVVVLHRDIRAIDDGLEAINLPGIPGWMIDKLNALDGLHIPYSALFDAHAAPAIWNTLRREPFDGARHEQLRRMNIQPEYALCVPDASVVMDFMQAVA